MSTTTWIPIPTYDGWYDLSADGLRVRSWRIHGGRDKTKRASRPTQLKPMFHSGSTFPRFALTTHEEGASKRRQVLVALRDLQVLCGLPVADEDDPSVLWYGVPAPYLHIYEMSTDGRVRVVMGRGGQRRRKPLVLKPFNSRGAKHTSIYRLSAEGVERALSHRTIAKMFPMGHPIREAALGAAHDSTEIVVVDLSSKYRRGCQPPNRKATINDFSAPDRVVEEIRQAWARRNLRRYPTVTVEILADLHLLTRRQVQSIIRGVEEVRA